ncbi:helix-turn-helix transcriptional regulator [Sphingobacterium paramultivorum]|uniref:Helix-turn-helix transcriptional regulator n=1 Tax=Sphingobacterium paramultivorum TaxID=2886510 RepID=A0A7G5E2L4_9SPHI|nr:MULTISPECIES: AraC family transcriptional regulator [Sphingobacterium]MCS4165692.1 AraC-like DNA-binding protein [Sphingobacterium sp. BIGb0116]QMV68239.1 helix-turn-helix transcriptional regulator [Sphingobacterium paramultivorum]WSO17157.1 AraC family transcriptional regulator [Sphingobacterium paramultivorum]
MRKKQFEPLRISEFIEDSFHLPPHEQNYYELVYIRSGKGTHVINKFELNYEPGDVFLISPEDKHYFNIEEKTHFLFILFTDTYFLQNKRNLKRYAWIMELMNDKGLKERKLYMDEHHRLIYSHILEAVRLYSNATVNERSDWLFDQLVAIFGLYKEISETQRLPQQHELYVDRSISAYIHRYIFSPEKLQVSLLAQKFNIAPSYFGIYFKKNFGTSLRAYINSYRIELIENRLKSKDYTLKQIAAELGFTDESHLSHFYKRAKGFSPLYFRTHLTK